MYVDIDPGLGVPRPEGGVFPVTMDFTRIIGAVGRFPLPSMLRPASRTATLARHGL
jgi:hypothetical protein